MTKPHILVVCIHNSARSQMAEEYLRMFGGDLFDVESAGIEPGSINPLVTELLKEDGIDISAKQTRSVFDLHRAGRSFDFVITVCDPIAGERCPIFPAEKSRLHWPFPDPSSVLGSDEYRLSEVRKIRSGIRDRAAAFVEEFRRSGVAK